MSSTKLPATFSVGTLPEGYQFNPQQYAEWLAENLEVSLDGSFPAGQIGGTRPTENVGVWYDTANLTIELWNGTKYAPATDVPIGAMIDWAGNASAAAPANYLICDGSLLQKADYAELYAVLRETWGTPPNADTFYLPNPIGRVIVASGQGDYNPPGNVLRALTGKMEEHPVGQYFGSESFQTVGAQVNAPVGLKRLINANAKPRNANYFSVVQPGMAMRKLIRYR